MTLLKALLYPDPKLRDVDDKQRARELLGASYWQLSDKTNAEREFQFLLIARPGFKLDEFYYPKAMRDFLEKIRENLIRQGVIRPIKPTETENAPPSVLRVHIVEQHRSRATAFLPFGVGQFEAGKDGLGWFFLSTQATAAATSLGTAVAYVILSSQNPYGFNDNNHQTASSLYVTSMVSGAVFWALATWGVIDANVRHVPKSIVRTEQRFVNERTADVGPPQPNKMRLAPPVAGGSR